MYILVCKRKEMLRSPQWDVGSRGIGPAYFCINWINTSLAGALRTAEDMLFTSWTFHLGDAVFPRLQAELVILALMMLFGKYSTYWIAERIFTITQLTLRPRGKKKKKVQLSLQVLFLKQFLTAQVFGNIRYLIATSNKAFDLSKWIQIFGGGPGTS